MSRDNSAFRQPLQTDKLSERLQRVLESASEKRAEDEKRRRSERAKVEYRNSIVTFIDILGFRELVKNASALDIFDSVQAIRGTAGNIGGRQSINGEELNWTRVFSFSDSIVRVRPYDSEYREGALFYELLDLVHAQTELAGQGILIRGGMTAGPIYFSEDVAYGPAFVRSYDLESSLANYPRIVIDPVLIKAVREDKNLRSRQHTLHDEMEYIKGLVRQGDDGIWFIDYLKASSSEFDDPQYYIEYLRDHKNMILNKARSLDAASPLVNKYCWLAKYHNRVSSSIFKGQELKKLKITNNDLPILDELLIRKNI